MAEKMSWVQKLKEYNQKHACDKTSEDIVWYIFKSVF